MLDPTLLRGQLAETAARLKQTRGFDLDVAGFERLEAERKAIQGRTQELQNLRNTRSKQIGMLKARGEDVSAVMAEVASFGEELKGRALLRPMMRGGQRVEGASPSLKARSIAVAGIASRSSSIVATSISPALSRAWCQMAWPSRYSSTERTAASVRLAASVCTSISIRSGRWPLGLSISTCRLVTRYRRSSR